MFRYFEKRFPGEPSRVSGRVILSVPDSGSSRGPARRDANCDVVNRMELRKTSETIFEYFCDFLLTTSESRIKMF